MLTIAHVQPIVALLAGILILIMPQLLNYIVAIYLIVVGKDSPLKTIGDLVAAQGRATAETLAKNGCPVRTFKLDRLDEASLGELLMHFMLETIIAAHLLGVDPFDQPAVEEGKVLAKRYLTGIA